jgi:hypothetical protein
MNIPEPGDLELDLEPESPAPETAVDPAAEAFSRLEGELALVRRAVQHLAAERADIVIPDYGPTLADMAESLGAMSGSIEGIAEHPAMRMTPESLGKRIEAVAESARRIDQDQINHARQELYEATSAIRTITRSARTAEVQRRDVFRAAGGGILVGILLWSFLPGTIARAMPESWQWAERMATRMLGESSRWSAGARLMQSESPQAWSALAEAAEIRSDNRDAIDACRKSAQTSRQSVQCTIKIKSLH